MKTEKFRNGIKNIKVRIDKKILLAVLGMMIFISMIFISTVSANSPMKTDFQVNPSLHIGKTNPLIGNLFLDIYTVPLDETPPLSITNLKNISYESNYINWTWKDPGTSDFDRVMIYINGNFVKNVSKGVKYYNATDLIPKTRYVISTHTVDTSGNINQTWRNNTARTAIDTTPPDNISNLKNITYEPTYINWTWNDPGTSDFDRVMIYINGNFVKNVSKGVQYYNLTGLLPNTLYRIGTHTVDLYGNINSAWINRSSMTAKDNVPPLSIEKLHDISYAPTYINWTWNDSSSADFAKVMIYVNGNFRRNVTKGGRYYNLTNLNANTIYRIGTHTVDTSGNINFTWVNHTARTAIANNKIVFITVGDPHIRDSDTTEQNRLKNVVKYINNRTDVNLTIVMGDETQSGSEAEFNDSKNIIKGLKRQWYAVPGNHDVDDNNATNSRFIKYYGPMEHIEKINGYQLLFVNIWKETVNSKKVLHWSFNFSKANKNMPTIVFLHGAVRDPPKGIKCKGGSNWTWSTNYFKYGASMEPELDKFTKLIGVFSGHVHWDTDQNFSTPLVPQVRYTTVNGLVDIDNGCQNVQASTKVGYSTLEDGKLSYTLIPYTGTGSMPISIQNVDSVYVDRNYRTDVDNETLR